MNALVAQAVLEEAPSSTERSGERGAGLVEYSMLVALIVIVCVAAVSLLGPATATEFSSIADGLN